MPFLLLDDASDEATRRLQQFGQDQLANLRQGAQDIGASAQDATQRLMQFGQGQLDSLQQQSLQPPPLPDVDQITGRLHAFGEEQLQQASDTLNRAQQTVQQGVQQLTPLQPLTPPANQGGQVQQGQNLTFPGGEQPGGAVDASSPQAFARSVAPYAQWAAQQLGIDPSWVASMMASESNYGKAPGNELFGVKALPGQKSQSLQTHEGEYGGTTMNQNFAVYDSPLESVQAWVNLIKNHYPGAVGAKDLPTFVHGLKSGGYFTAAEDEYRNILSSIQGRIGGDVQGALSGAQSAAGGAVQGARSAVGAAQGALGQLSQFGDQELSSAEAYAACGPAAAVRFAEMFGRNPTLREAVELAKQVGWNAGQGMAGLSSEGSLFDKMGIPHRTVGADWDALAKEASSGNPVVISTPGHYFTADAYDPQTGAFHVGQSGKDLRLGSEWMTPAQMEGAMGRLQGGLAVDNPGVSAPSPLSSPPTGGGSSGQNPNLIDVAKQKVQQGISALDQSGVLQTAGDLATGGLTRRFNENLAGLGQDVAGAASPGTGAVADSLNSLSNPNDQLGLDPLRGFRAPSPDDLGGFIGDRFNDLGSALAGEGEREDEIIAQNPWLRDQKPIDWTKPLGPQLGVDPYGDIVEHGVPDILQGLSDRDIGKVAGGAWQTLGGVGAALPGPNGPRGAAGRSILDEVASNPAVRDFLESEEGALNLPTIDQATLQAIRSGGLVAGPTTPSARGAIGTGVDVTKQFMLSNPATHVANIVGNTLELLRSPAALTLGGRPLDAIAGSGAVMQGIPEAASAALQALKGAAPATLGGPAQTSRWWEPVYKALGAADQFTRTLGEYQGMAEQASALLRQAGISPNDPAAASFLNTHAAELVDAGRRAGGNTVFAMQRTPTGGLGFLDNLFHNYSHWKEGLLNSPNLRDQALGALADTQIPFAGVPSRILQIGLGRLPGVGTATAGWRAAAAARAGNLPEMQRQIGNAMLEGMFTALIVKNIADGNIRGPDDPDHPGEVRVLGNWINGGALGAYALPAMISAAAVDGFRKPLDKPADSVSEALMTKAGNALTASFKPFLQAVPGMQMVHFLSALGDGPGKALQGELEDTINRITAPGAAKFIEDLTDPTQRDVSQGLAGLWESPMSKWPGLAQLLPARVDPTTGEPMEKRRSGLGTLVGAESYDESAIREEANRLSKLGYDTTPPSKYPDSVTVGNAIVPLKPDEQRAVTEITGQRLGSFTDAIQSPSYQAADDDTKARMMRAYLAAADRARLSAAVQVIGYPDLMARAQRGQRVVGRLVQEAPEDIPSLEQMLAGAGR